MLGSELSTRFAKLTDTDTVRALSAKQNIRLRGAVARSATFVDLPKYAKELIVKAEEELGIV